MSLESKIESLLFISGRPMSVRELSELSKVENKEVEEACDKLLASRKSDGAGIQIVKNGSSYQMVTSPDNTETIQEFVKDETTGELSRPSLETLTIVAYRGPVSKTDLDRIRGVNCGMIIHNLLMRGLIDAREDKKKEETYYTVTFDFLKFLGLNEVKDLPDFERLSADDTIDRILAENGENEPKEQAVAIDASSAIIEDGQSKPTDEMTDEQKAAILAEALQEIATDGGSTESEEIEDEDEEEFDDEDDEDESEESDEKKEEINKSEE